MDEVKLPLSTPLPLRTPSQPIESRLKPSSTPRKPIEKRPNPFGANYGLQIVLSHHDRTTICHHIAVIYHPEDLPHLQSRDRSPLKPNHTY